MFIRETRGWVAAAVGAALTTVATEGATLPRPGHTADAKVEDVDGKVFRPSAYKGRPILVVYEDKESKDANVAFKADLTRLMKEKPLRDAVVLAAVADVSEYDSWPAKGFVKDAIRDEQKKSGTTIWCDWTASFRKAFDLTKGQSNVLVLGRDGRVRFAAAGPLSAAQRASVEALIRAEVAAR